jgi:DNA-binding Lrp family transcriptional regulator
VLAFDEHVGGHHHAAVYGAHHRRIVTGSECDGLRLFAIRHQPVDNGELTHPGEGLRLLVGRHVTSPRLRYVWALRREVYAARGRKRVVEAFMLIQTEVGRAEVVAKQLATLPGVLSSEYVTGPYDVVVRIGANDLADLQANVVPSVQQVTGITRTLTCPIANGVAP